MATMAAVACLKGKCHMVITRPTLHNRNELRLEFQKCCVFIKTRLDTHLLTCYFLVTH